MTITFVTNYVHHHQLPLADEFYRILGGNYNYIATKPLPDWLIKGGYDPTLERPYIIRSYQSDSEMKIARRLIDESDVVIAGMSPEEWYVVRNCKGKPTFYYKERPYKEYIPWLKLPLHAFKNYKRYGKYDHTYLLCASAFTAYDYRLTHCFTKRSFKWGYLTAVPMDDCVFRNLFCKNGVISIMWCARFLWWKHPELPVMLATRLKAKGYSFVIDMYGSGEEIETIEKKIFDLNVTDVVKLRGNLPNSEILNEMRQHDFFLFTSDRNEGWGAVLNEAMSNGCIAIAGDSIGSVPYLIKNEVNGMVFKSGNLDSLEEVVIKTINNSEKLKQISDAAIMTMRTSWSPSVAATNFLDLAQHVLDGKLNEYNRIDGPASWDKKLKQ